MIIDNIYDIYSKVEKIIQLMEKTIFLKDVEKWISFFDLKDDLAIEAQKNWYLGYSVIENPVEQHFTINSIKIETGYCKVNLIITLQYEDFDTIIEDYLYHIQIKDNVQDPKIIWFEKVPHKLEASGNETGTVSLDFQYHEFELKMLCEYYKKNETWKSNEDQISEYYSRFISRSIRFREANPLIESATLVANIMSYKLLYIAKQVYAEDKLTFLINLYNATRNKVFIQLVRQDRDNTWVSKFTAPAFGVDEMIVLNQADKKIRGTCSQIMSMYYAILRTRFEPSELYLIRFTNQDVLLIKIQDELYMLSDELRKVNNRTLFYNSKINKIFNETFIYSNEVLYNMSEADYLNIINYLMTKMPNFKFPNTVKKQIKSSDNKGVLQICFDKNMELKHNHTNIVTEVLNLSKLYPNSVYTGAKYAYQTILVEKLDAYLKSSEQSASVIKFIQEFNDFQSFNAEIKKFSSHSIFSETHRIMTAEQVIRNRTGDLVAMSFLYYIWFKQVEKSNVSIEITEEDIYCKIANEDKLRWFSIRTKSFEKRTRLNDIFTIKIN